MKMSASQHSHCHCVFCLKPTTTATKASSSQVARYLDLLERHVGGQQQLLEPRRRSGPRRSFSVCGGCSRALESFSNLYGQCKELELRLEWEVAKLSAVVEHANRVPLRGSFVKGCYEGEGEKGEGKEMMEEMYAWRRSLSKRCSSKLSKSFPKIKLARRRTTTTNATMEHQFAVKREVEEVVASTSPSSSQSHDVIKDKTGGGSGGDDAEANSIDIKYEIPRPPRPNSPEPDLPDDHLNLSSSSITGGSFAESPSSSSPFISTSTSTSIQQSSSQIESSAAEKSTSSSSQAHKWCAICSILFRTGYHFRSHYSRAHDFVRAGVDESEAARCSHCPAYFVSRRVLTLHVMRAHQQTQVKSEDQRQRFRFRCSKCPKSFFTKTSLTAHVRSQHDLTGIRAAATAADVKRCKVSGCSAYFRTSRQLHTHRLEFHARQLLKSPAGAPCICIECGKAFVSRYKLDLHKRSEHPAAASKKPTTPVSPKIKHLLHGQQADSRTSDTTVVIKQEVVEEEPVPPPANAPPVPPPPRHQCQQCGKVLSCPQSMYYHLLRHKGPQFYKYPCPTCGKRFIASDKRRVHMVAVHKSTSTTTGMGSADECHSSGAIQ